MQEILDTPEEEDLPKDIMQKAALALSEKKKALKAKQQKSRNPTMKLPGSDSGAKAPNRVGNIMNKSLNKG